MQSFMLLDLRKGCSLCLEHRSPISHGRPGPSDCSSGLFPLHPWAASGIQASSKLCAGHFHFLPTWGSPRPPPTPHLSLQWTGSVRGAHCHVASRVKEGSVSKLSPLQAARRTSPRGSETQIKCVSFKLSPHSGLVGAELFLSQ